MFTEENRFNVRCVFAVLLGFSFMLPAPRSSAAAPEGCAAAMPLDLNATFRGQGYEDEKTSCFKLEIPGPGVVSLEISVPGGSEVHPRLGRLTADSESPGSTDGKLAVAEQSAGHMIFVVEAPGTYYLRSGAQDPRRWLPGYKVTAGYYETTASRLASLDLADPILDLSTTTEGPVEVDPDPDMQATAEEPVEVDPDPDSLAVGSAADGELQKLCPAARSDDHGDTSTCATPVVTGGRTAGELANGWGDDYDFFTFTLTELETVAIGTSGTADTFGTLFDSSRRRLAMDDDSGDGSNFLIVRTLSPGRYFVRVEGGRHAEGLYEMSLATVDW